MFPNFLEDTGAVEALLKSGSVTFSAVTGLPSQLPPYRKLGDICAIKVRVAS